MLLGDMVWVNEMLFNHFLHNTLFKIYISKKRQCVTLSKMSSDIILSMEVWELGPYVFLLYLLSTLDIVKQILW